MTNESSRYRQLWQRVRMIESRPELHDLFQQIKADDSLTHSELSDLLPSVFTQLREATVDSAEEAIPIITNELLNFCLGVFPIIPKGMTSSDRDLRNRDRGRKELTLWVEQYPEATQLRIIPRLLNFLRASLHTDQARNACLVLSELGYRDDLTIAQLFNAAELDQTADPCYLNAIVALGVISDERLPILARRVIQSDKPHRAGFAISHMDLAITTPLIEECIHRLESHPEHSAYLHVALSTCVRAVVRHSLNDSLQTWYWGIVHKHKNVVLLDSQLVSSLDSSAVVPTLLSWVHELKSIEDESFRLWRIALRLDDCTRQRQLDGWKVEVQSETLSFVHAIAVRNTGDDTNYSTVQDDAKRAAWRILFSLGQDNAKDLLTSAVATESNRHLQGQLMQMASYFAIGDLPDFVSRLVVSEFNCDAGDVLSMLVREGAIAIARTSGSYDGFESLLKCGYTYDGHVMLNSTEALADAALHLYERGMTRVLNDLVQSIGQYEKPQHREAACRALSHFGEAIRQNDEYVNAVIDAIVDVILPAYARGDLISALSRSEFAFDSRAVREIVRLAEGESDERILVECGVFLIRQPFWEEYVSLIWKLVGWNGESDEDGIAGVNGWRAWLVGELFNRDSVGFGSVLNQVVETCNDDTCYQLWQCVRNCRTFPGELADALERRIITKMTPYHSSAYIFSFLALVDYRRLLSHPIRDSVTRWTVEAKVAYISTLEQVTSSDPDFLGRRLAWLDAVGSPGTELEFAL